MLRISVKENKKKDNIYFEAKKLLLSKGFKNTTIQQIATNAGVPKALVMYYYKKEDFVSLIYIDFINAIRKRIEDTVGNKLGNAFQLQLITTRIFFNIIFNSDSYKNLYKEILFNQLLPINSPAHEIVRKPLILLVEEFDINISEEVFELALEAEFGGILRLMRTRFDKLNPKISAPFIYFISTISARLIEIPGSIINDNVSRSEELLKEIDYYDIPFIDLNEDASS